MITAPTINLWQTYLSVAAEAAATLTGLVFVAVSINLARIVEIPGLPSLAVDSMSQLLGVVFIALASLVPGQRLPILGGEVLTVAVVLWLIQARLQIAYVRSDTGHPRQWATTRMLRTFAACLPFLIGGILMIRGSATGMYWFLPGVLLSIVAGVLNAWVLLVEVIR